MPSAKASFRVYGRRGHKEKGAESLDSDPFFVGSEQRFSVVLRTALGSDCKRLSQHLFIDT